MAVGDSDQSNAPLTVSLAAQVCRDGAENGNETAAVNCLDAWKHKVLPFLKASGDKVNEILEEALPAYDAEVRAHCHM